MSLPIKHITRLLDKAFDKKEENKAWDMWLVKYEYMNKDNFVPFSEFLKQTRQPQVSVTTNETVEETFNRFKSKIKKR
ncbi:hypothetical protein [Alkalihalobacillus sp. BA299]|uniref:hypothetical protein n=1 Tax=Alkalihalobacillus sp. BA299 TaxID=2815938 RepID=UPI001ADB0BCF|nr:hypothetical protein [Alkalihalobacillus sp. BA299]